MPPDRNNRVTLEIEQNYSAQERLDVLVTNRLPKISRNRVQKLIGEGLVTLNGKKVKASTPVPGGATIEVIFPHPPRPPAESEDIPLEIVFEDEHLLVIDKPAGMVVHPAAGHHGGTLVNALLGRYDNLPVPGGPSHRPGIVHRLDKDTSGLIVVARNEQMMTDLGRLFHEHDIEREYSALVWGSPPDEGTIDAPISRHPGNRQKFAIVEGGRRAVTHWRIIERFESVSHVALVLETGRTHQIRVHMSSRGWPVFCDATYGGKMHRLDRMHSHEQEAARAALKRIGRQALHAGILGFIHPATGEHLLFKAPIPRDMLDVIEMLRKPHR